MTDDDARTCPAEHRDDRPRRAAEGSVLCRWCIEHGRENLTDLPRRYDELAEALKPGKSHQQRVSGTPDKTLPIVPAVAEHRGQIKSVLLSWALMVAEERGLRGPETAAPAVTAGWLAVHHDWAMREPWSDDYCREIDGLARRAFSLLYPSGRRTFVIPNGRCRAIYPSEDGTEIVRCSGGLYAIVRDDADMLPSELRCDRCDASITADKWIQTGREIRQDDAA